MDPVSCQFETDCRRRNEIPSITTGLCVIRFTVPLYTLNILRNKYEYRYTCTNNVGYACVHFYVFPMYRYVGAQECTITRIRTCLNVCAAYGARTETQFTATPINHIAYVALPISCILFFPVQVNSYGTHNKHFGETPDGILAPWMFWQDDKASSDFWLIYDPLERFAATRYREADLTFPRGIERSRVYRRHPAGDRPGSPLEFFHLDLPRASNETAGSFIVGSSTAGRAMQQEHRKSNQTIHQP